MDKIVLWIVEVNLKYLIKWVVHKEKLLEAQNKLLEMKNDILKN